MANRANLSALFVALLAKANIFDIYVYKHTYLSHVCQTGENFIHSKQKCKLLILNQD